MVLRDFNFPFEAGAVNLGARENDYWGFWADKECSFLRMTQMSDDGFFNLYIKYDEPIGEQVGGWKKENIETIYSILSILLYMGRYSGSTERVSPKQIVTSKGSKKKGISKHRIHIIKLKQYEGAMKGHHNGGGGVSDKSWIVRGHFRNQYYSATNSHKVKWIEPYWKGSGVEDIEKVYQI